MNRTHWPRRTVLAVALVTLPALALWCSGGGEAAGAGKAAEITLKLSGPADRFVPNSYVITEMQKRLGVKIEIISDQLYNPGNYERLTTMIASGETPDYIGDGFPVGVIDQWIKQGVLAEVPPDLIAQHAPRYIAWLNKWLGDSPFRYGMRNGKNYYMPVLWTLGTHFKVMGARADWMKKVGIAASPQTVDELVTLLRKFTTADPDGNGKNDTYGISSSGYAGFDAFFGAYGVYPEVFYEDKGSVVRGEVQPAAKEALTLLNQLYREGVIDPEFVVNKGDNMLEKWIAERYGSLESAWWDFLPANAFYVGAYYERLKQKNPSAEIAIFAQPKGPRGESGTVQVNPNRGGVLFGKHMEKDRAKLIKYIEHWEFTSFDPDGLQLRMSGVEGKTFKKTENGIEWMPPYDKQEERDKFGIFYTGTHFNDYDLQSPYMTSPKYMPLRRSVEGIGQGKFDVLEQVNMPTFNENRDRLSNLTKKSFIDFIVGQRPIGEFDRFVQEWKAAGGDAVMKEAQQAYATYFGK